MLKHIYIYAQAATHACTITTIDGNDGWGGDASTTSERDCDRRHACIYTTVCPKMSDSKKKVPKTSVIVFLNRADFLNLTKFIIYRKQY